MTKIGLIGCGDWGRHVLRDLHSLECEVPVVARSDASRARAEQGGAACVVAGIDELPACDGYVVAVSTTAHTEVLEELLPRAAPIFVEKPLCTDLAEAQRLAEAGRDLLFVMDKWRYHPGVIELARIARGGELGRPIGLHCTRVSWRRKPSDVDALWHLMPHDLAIALDVLGEIPEPVAAVAEPTPSGQIGTVTALFGTGPWLTSHVSETRRAHHRESRLVCEEGTAVLSGAYSEALTLTRLPEPIEAGPPEPELRPIPTSMPLFDELAAFVGHVRGTGPAPLSPVGDALRQVEVLAAVEALLRR